MLKNNIISKNNAYIFYLYLKSQKEANFSKGLNIKLDKTNSKSLLNTNNVNLNREEKLKKNGSEFTIDNKKETTINSNSNKFNNSLNNYYEYQQIRNISLNSIDDKYKYLENPFTNPEMPKNADEERRARIIERINKDRKSQYKSQSVDNARYKKNEDIEKRANYLGNQLFGDENEILK